jgi:PIN domain nuclease of toxin-antitoxin system
VRLLLDTNALYWLFSGSARLGNLARASVLDAASIIVSDVSLLEISIKVSIGKLPRMPGLHQTIRDEGIERAGIEERYLSRLESLPLHHRDPFDRMLVAQALSDDLTVLTADPVFAKYGVRVVDAAA